MPSNNSKIYVLDTNVILHNANALYMFEDNMLIVPIVVVEEIDRFKKDIDEKGRNARQFSRIVDKLSKKGSLAEGVEMENGGHLKIVMNGPHKKLESYPFRDTNDNLIISAALEAQELEEAKPDDERWTVKLVSQDANVRIKAHALKIEAESFEGMEVKFLHFSLQVVGFEDGFKHCFVI